MPSSLDHYEKVRQCSIRTPMQCPRLDKNADNRSSRLSLQPGNIYTWKPEAAWDRNVQAYRLLQGRLHWVNGESLSLKGRTFKDQCPGSYVQVPWGFTRADVRWEGAEVSTGSNEYPRDQISIHVLLFPHPPCPTQQGRTWPGAETKQLGAPGLS